MKEKVENLVKGSDRTILTRFIRRSASTNENRIYIMPIQGMWGIKLEGRNRFYRRYVDKATAVRIAKNLASKGDVTLVVVHGKDGRVTSSTSYLE